MHIERSSVRNLKLRIREPLTACHVSLFRMNIHMNNTFIMNMKVLFHMNNTFMMNMDVSIMNVAYSSWITHSWWIGSSSYDSSNTCHQLLLYRLYIVPRVHPKNAYSSWITHSWWIWKCYSLWITYSWWIWMCYGHVIHHESHIHDE